ncbi:MAG: glycosyltransferase [Rhizobacter sp.]|nr:glycosyltransferase [Ferruginibacter sp.]
MKVAHIIIFHEDAILIERLVRSMAHPDFDFYLHLDRKVDIVPFKKLSLLPNVFFIRKRKKVSWGGYSQVEAITNSLEQIFENGTPAYDFINLLSGQDYPIKTTAFIHSFLLNNLGRSFLMSETPPSAWWEHAVLRFTRYHFVEYGFRGRYRLADVFSKLLPRRKFPLPGKLYGGPDGAYWILSADAAKYAWTILKKRDRRWWFFKHTWGPDEFLINTILMNSPFAESIINENYHFIDRSQGSTRPKTLTSGDFNALQQSNKFFARKFDRKLDAEVLDRIDKELLFLPGTVNVSPENKQDNIKIQSF